MTERPQREGIMLAYPADDGRILRASVQDMLYCQPKFRGQRCRTEWFHDEPVLLSSYQNQFRFLQHLEAVLKSPVRYEGKEYDLIGVPLDGEIYNHEMGQEEINSIANRTVNKHPDSDLLEYWIYDIQLPNVPQQQRLIALQNMEKIGLIRPPLFLSPLYVVTTQSWLFQAKEFIDQGYEGAILRCPNGLYQMKRSTSLLKWKPTEKDHYLIVGVEEAIDKHGNPKGMVGSYWVEDNEGLQFKVSAGKQTHSERIAFFLNQPIGRQLSVKHEPVKTNGGVPLCAVAVEVE